MKQVFSIALFSILFVFGGCTDKSKAPYSYFYNPDLGISFAHNPDWTFEVKYTKDTNEPHIVGHTPIGFGYFKMMTISFSKEEIPEMAIKMWWLNENAESNIAENRITYEQPQTNRYQGITYAANRAKIAVPEHNSALDYRVFATRKNGRTIVICEKSDIGGMDGLEGDGFAVVEKSINYMKY